MIKRTVEPEPAYSYYIVAPPHTATDNAGAFLFVAAQAALGGKKAPALTVSQLRMILDVALPLRTYSVEDVLKLVALVAAAQSPRLSCA